MLITSLKGLLYFDHLTAVMSALIGFIGLTVGVFAKRFMQGDRHYYHFFGQFGLLIISLELMVAADNVFLLLITWVISNFLLVRLMIHKSQWKAAQAAGLLAGATFCLGFVFIAAAFLLFYLCTGSDSVQTIIHQLNAGAPLGITALMLLVMGAATQSGIWPFHRWLISSLNSPTPVSAIMHAGLVNGGGFLLARFAPLYCSQPSILTILFIIGLTTAMIGTLWKLMQHDVKRMLACSTMGQMGFMFAQCGLGLFPAAMTHLVCHGLFKANLFLSSSSAAQEKKLSTDNRLNGFSIASAITSSILATFLFAAITHKTFFADDTNLILLCMCFITAMQFSLVLFAGSSFKQLPLFFIVIALATVFYGESVSFFERLLLPLSIMHPQPLNWFYITGIIVLASAWLLMMFKSHISESKRLRELLAVLYVNALNASQPHPSTTTNLRKLYRF